MKRLVLHVGTMKTGTTAIQAFLAQNEAVLAERGICYPTDFGRFANANPNRNGNFLMRAVCGRVVEGYKSGHLKRHVPQAIEKFKRHVSEFDTVVLSEETLWRCGVLHEGYWEGLRDLVGECGVDEVDAIVYLRRQDEYAESRWRQWVKGLKDYTKTFEEYCADPDSMAPNDYARGLDLLAAAFGREHLTVRVYDRERFVDHDIVKDFLASTGLPLDAGYDFEVRGSRARNQSLSEDFTELKRLANMAPGYRAGSSNYLKGAAAEAMGGAVEATGTPEAKWHMGPERAAAFLERYREGNARVAREYLGIEDGKLFDEPDPGRAGWQADPEELLRKSVTFYAEALAEERAAREKSDARVKELERRVAALERSQGIGSWPGKLYRYLHRKR